MRNKKNAQYMVGIPRGSEMHRFYLEESERQGVKLPTYIYLLLQDRYEALQGRGKGIWFPRGNQIPTVPTFVEQEEDFLEARVATRPHIAVAALGGEDEDE